MEEVEKLRGLADSFFVERNYLIAEQLYKRLLVFEFNINALYNLGVIYHEKFDELNSREVSKRLISIEPNNTTFLAFAGLVECRFNNPVTGIYYFDKAIEKNTQEPNVFLDRAMAYLSIGRYQEGFRDFECRFLKHPEVFRPKKFPVWNGENLNGKKIIVTDEQGIGDTIQYLRFLFLLNEYSNSEIYFECDKKFWSLLKSFDFITLLEPQEDNLIEFDFYCPLMSLPSKMNISKEFLMESTPYLYAGEGVSKVLNEKLEDVKLNKKFKVGIVWDGKKLPFDRSIPTEYLSILLSVCDVSFYSLQIGSELENMKKLNLDFFIKDMVSMNSDFSDVSVIMKNMDLILSIDTYSVHLAGALGVPCWLLLPLYSDWRWGSGDKCDWYKSVKIFRQKSHGEWLEIINSVCEELSKITKKD